MKKGSYLEKVRKQYENYPYPAREPNDEKAVLYSSKSSSLDCLNFYCFNGERDFTKPFRVLIPGGGTGDCTIYLAEQLRGTPAEVVYLDMSQASMKIAKARAKLRKLDNITWVHDSILNLPTSGLGKFDFITCSGVLHHLEDPQAGLDALKSVLDPDGSIFLMLYAQYGRTAIYQMQDLLRKVFTDETDIQKQIDLTKRLIKGLPDGNWFNFNSHLFNYDLQTDIGIYDLLLHPQDRAYSIPDLYDYAKKSGLVISKLFNSDHPLGDMLFQPETFISDPETLNEVSKKSFEEQAAICELLFGQLMKQCCFISFEKKTAPSLNNLNLVPSIAVASSRAHQHEELKAIFSTNTPAVKLNPFVSFNRSKYTNAIFQAIDGKRSSAEIIDFVATSSPAASDKNQVTTQFKVIVDLLIKLSIVTLRDPALEPYKTIPRMLSRMIEAYGASECEKAFDDHKKRTQV